MDLADLAIRLAVATALAAALGIEREAAGKAAGLRTYAMVGLGSAVFTVLSMEAFGASDTSRVAAQIVSGIGFLGAGAIFRSGPLIKGLTTAAGLWAAAAVGMAAGSGQLLWAVVAAAMAMVVLVGLRLLDPLLDLLRPAVRVEARVVPAHAFLAVRERILQIDPEIDLLDVRSDEDGARLTLAVTTRAAETIRHALTAMEEVREARIVE